jgi:hypothetical protein
MGLDDLPAARKQRQCHHASRPQRPDRACKRRSRRGSPRTAPPRAHHDPAKRLLQANQFTPLYRADFAGLQPTITYTVEQVAEGARFTRAVDMHPSGLKVLMTPMMAIMVPRQNSSLSRISNARLKVAALHRARGSRVDGRACCGSQVFVADVRLRSRGGVLLLNAAKVITRGGNSHLSE